MSLFGSLQTAIDGMNAQQDWIGNISDNIANSQTVGYKTIDTEFQNLVTQSTPEFNNPGGVLAGPVYQNALQGTVVQSATDTSLALSGQGFFIVSPPPAVSASGTTSTFSGENLYTRRGDFTINNQGYLVNGAGYYLEGNTVNPATGVADTSTVSPIQISQLSVPASATANLNLEANLPAAYPVSSATGYTAPSPVTETIYDAQGVAHQATIQFNHTSQNVWTAAISVAGQTNTPTDLTLTFSDGSGTTGNTAPAGTLVSSTEVVAGKTTSVPATQTTGSPADIPLTVQFAGTGSNTLTQSINLNLGQFGENEGSVAGQGLVQTNATGTTSQIAVGALTQDGYPAGSFQSVAIDSNGYVNVSYSNGVTQPYFQIPIANFPASLQLQRLDGGAYQATLASGNPVVNQPGQNGAATLDPSALENSTVDIAGQFTQLITAQQAYTANSKVITTVDTLLSTVIALVQT